MSLDVYLEKKVTSPCGECGHKKGEREETVYSSNITHNLGEMADKAGIYYALWHPDEKGWTKAAQIIPKLEKGLEKLKAKPEYFKQFNSSNGWGLYEHFVPFVEEYLQACKNHPDANVRTWT